MFDALDPQSILDFVNDPDSQTIFSFGFDRQGLLEGDVTSARIVPEPSTALLLMLGAVFAAHRARV